ncbi:MAG: hypothetical protein WD894_06805 [Pirellulales bacterium]
MTKIVPDEVIKLAAQHLKSPESEWWVRELTKSFKWLKDEELYWVFDTDSDKSVMALRESGGDYKCLNCQGGLPIIGQVISERLGKVPSDKFSVSDLAQLLMQWHQDPRGYIATPEFFKKKQDQDALDSWLMGTEKDPAVLRSMCVSPTYTNDDAGNWKLTFNALNQRGGVDQWLVNGKIDKFEIKSVKIMMLKPKGTFYYPDEL